jgi:hypothetical protein
MKAVAKFDIDFAPIIPVEATESDAVVKFDAAVRHVHRMQGRRDALAEVFPESPIERSVLWESVAGTAVASSAIGIKVPTSANKSRNLAFRRCMLCLCETDPKVEST